MKLTKLFCIILTMLFIVDNGQCASSTKRSNGRNARVAVAGGTTVRSTSTQSNTSVFSQLNGCQKTFADCMDKICNLGNDKGERCSCSSKITSLDLMIDEIKTIQAKAEDTATTGVERAKMGAKWEVVSETEKGNLSTLTAKNSNVAKIDMSIFENYSKSAFDSNVTSSIQNGDDLYKTAYSSCLKASSCSEDDMKMVKIIYDRQISEDCNTYSDYLNEQKKIANDNLKNAEKMVRQARYENIDTQNKYNRGECLIAMRDCVKIKGGCGDNFENCLDKDLLQRRANACEDITDQCLAVRDYVKSDFQEEMIDILKNAEKYADQNKRQTCFSKIESCLETGCSPQTNSACLNDIKIAKNVCPVIDECEKLIPGIAEAMESKLGYLRIRFCQNEAESCFKEKCGSDYSAPECIGKSVEEIEKMCPQKTLVSCKGIPNYSTIRSSVFLRLDYQLLQGCVNYFSSKLSESCGLDMSCIKDNSIDKLTSVNDKFNYEKKAETLVNDFFKKFEKDSTIENCSGKVGSYVFETAKFLARNQVEQNLWDAYTKKLVLLTKEAKLADAKSACLKLKNEYGAQSATFDEATRLCQITRVQADCQAGGQTVMSGILKGNISGSVGGAGLGTSISPGWGTLIGAAAMGTVGAVAGGLTSKKIDFCTEVPVKQEIQM